MDTEKVATFRVLLHDVVHVSPDFAIFHVMFISVSIFSFSAHFSTEIPTNRCSRGDKRTHIH